MPVKIKTDQPEAKRETYKGTLTTSMTTLFEPPYFSVPLLDEDTATLDPQDDQRELRSGETFLATSLRLVNRTTSEQSVTVQVTDENGDPFLLAYQLVVPPHDVLNIPAGLSLFKRDLISPNNSGMLLQALASSNSAIDYVITVIEREAIEHAADTESGENAVGPAPFVVATVPVDGEIEVSPASDIFVIVNSQLALTQGQFVLRNITDDVTIETFTLATGTGDNGGTISQTPTGPSFAVKITPGANLPVGVSLCIQWSNVISTEGGALPNNSTDTEFDFSTLTVNIEATSTIEETVLFENMGAA